MSHDTALDEAVDMILASHYEGFHYSIDLGCGNGSFGSLLKQYTDWLVGVDHDETKLDNALKMGYDDVIWADLNEFDIPVHADSIFMFETIEHFPKEIGYEILQRLLSSPAKFIMISTPESFYSDFVAQHLSLWTIEDFQELGFIVYRIPAGFRVYPIGSAWGNLLVAVKT